MSGYHLNTIILAITVGWSVAAPHDEYLQD